LYGQRCRKTGHLPLGDGAREAQNTVLDCLSVGGSSFLGGDLSLDNRGNGDVKRVHVEYVVCWLLWVLRVKRVESEVEVVVMRRRWQ
jgi:hypothetical protein